jgi:hypothetical protein
LPTGAIYGEGCIAGTLVAEKGAGAKIQTVLEATCQRWRSSELKSFRPERQSNV